MSQDKEIIKKLFTVVAKQQQILTKLAQQPMVPPTSLEPKTTTRDEASVIMNALPVNVKSSIARLEAHPSTDPNYYKEIRVRFVPGRSTPGTFNVLQQTISNLSKNNSLPGGSYSIKEVA